MSIEQPQGAGSGHGSPSSWDGVLTDPNLYNAIVDFFTALILSLEAFFQGRPQAQATQQAASRLLKSPNVAARVYAMMLLRGLKELDVDISQSGPRAQIEADFFGVFVQNLENQGVTHVRAFDIASHALSREAQAGAPLEPELLVHMPQNFQLYGIQKFATYLQNLIANEEARGLIGDAALTEAAKQLYLHGPLAWWAGSQFAPAQPTGLFVLNLQSGSLNPPPPPVTIPTQQNPGEGPPPPVLTISPITGQPLPDGFGWDRTTQQPLLLDPNSQLIPPDGYQFNPCTNATEPLPSSWQPGNPLGPPPPIPATQSPAQPFDLCCSLIVQSIQYLAATVYTTGASGAGANLLPVMQELSATLTAIKDQLAAASGGSPGPGGSENLAEVVKALKEIAGKFDASNSDIAAAAVTLAKNDDVPQGIIDKLFESGYLPDAYRDLIQGAPPATVKPVTDTTTADTPAERRLKDIRKLVVYDPTGAFKLTPKEEAAATKLGATVISEVASDAAAAAEKLFDGAFDVGKGLFGGVITAMLDAHKTQIARLGHVNPGDETAVAADLLTEAMTFGTGAHFAAIAAENLNPFKNLGIGQLAGLFAELAGFGEVMRGIIGVEMQQAIALPHRYYINAQKRSTQATQGQAAEWFARRLIDEPRFQQLIAWNGLHPDNEEPAKTSAFRPLQTRALVRELGILNVDEAPIRAAMQFQGVRDADIDTAIDGFKQAGHLRLTTPIIDRVVALGSKGLFSEAEISSELAALNLTTEASNLILTRIRLARLEANAERFKVELDELAGANEITIGEYQTSLAAIGFQQEEIDIAAGIVSAKLEKAALNAAAREQAQELRATKQAALMAAVQEYRRGLIDAPTFAIALDVAGFTPPQIAAHLATSTATLQPTLKVGTKLTAFARKQTDQSAAIKVIKEKYTRGELLPAAAIAELEGQGMSSNEALFTVRYLYWASLKKGSPVPPAGTVHS